MADPGQTAYEARFTDEDRRKRYANEWARLGPIEREMWARVEAASINAVGKVLDGDDRISAALRTINFETAAIKASATERVEKAEAELRRLNEGLEWLKAKGLDLCPVKDGWHVLEHASQRWPRPRVLGFGETPIAAIIYARSQVPE